MPISFTKMNSQGNDFIVIDIAQEKFLEDQDNIKKICSRDAVGCDQLLLINTSNPGEVACTIYNSDGTSASQCGNGLRAIMLYLHKKFSITESTIKVCTKVYNAQIIGKNKISVDLGRPKFFTEKIDGLIKFREEGYTGEVVDVGNKHFVVWGYRNYRGYIGDVSEDRRLFVRNSGHIYSEELDYHSEKLNELQSQYNLTFILCDESYDGYSMFRNFALDDNSMRIKVKVKERGAGWTKSCGSGAIAAAAIVLDLHYQMSGDKGELEAEERWVYDKKWKAGYHELPSPIIVEQEGGVLEVYHDNSRSLKLVGPSEFEYVGEWSA